jgi:hypothetical protein
VRRWLAAAALVALAARASAETADVVGFTFEVPDGFVRGPGEEANEAATRAAWKSGTAAQAERLVDVRHCARADADGGREVVSLVVSEHGNADPTSSRFPAAYVNNVRSTFPSTARVRNPVPLSTAKGAHGFQYQIELDAEATTVTVRIAVLPRERRLGTLMHTARSDSTTAWKTWSSLLRSFDSRLGPPVASGGSEEGSAASRAGKQIGTWIGLFALVGGVWMIVRRIVRRARASSRASLPPR